MIVWTFLVYGVNHNKFRRPHMEKRKEITQKMETVAKKTDSTFFLGGR